MEMKRIIPALVVVVAVLICGCLWSTGSTPTPTISLSTDKDTYFERETLTLNASIVARADINATLSIFGIKSTRGNYAISEQREINLTAGKPQMLSLAYTLPSCSRCAGIESGAYNITAQVVYNGTVISESNVSVNLTKRG